MYRDIDLSIYTDLPGGLRDVMGIPDGADAAALAFNVMFGTLGALTLAGIAISIGAGAIAGEEQAGTMGLLLANPTPRSRVLLAKAVALVALVAVAGLGLWAAGHVAPAVLDVDTGSMHIGAMALHLSVNALFYGFLALAIGAATGNRTLASGAAAAVMAVSFVAAGLLPTIDAIADGVKALPWYYFDGSQPLLNGISWGHLAVPRRRHRGLRRDRRHRLQPPRPHPRRRRRLASPERLHANPVTRRNGERMTGPARARARGPSSRRTPRAPRGRRRGHVLDHGRPHGRHVQLHRRLACRPRQRPARRAACSVVGAGDTSTPEGWLQLETFGLMVPIAVIGMAMLIAVRGIAGEEQRGTMGLLLANPIPRRQVVLQTALAMTIYATVVGLAVFAGTALGSIIAGLGVSIANLAAASLLGTLLGLAFGALALALGAPHRPCPRRHLRDDRPRRPARSSSTASSPPTPTSPAGPS